MLVYSVLTHKDVYYTEDLLKLNNNFYIFIINTKTYLKEELVVINTLYRKLQVFTETFVVSQLLAELLKHTYTLC